MAVVFLGIDVITAIGRPFDFSHFSRIVLVTAFFYFVFVDFAEEVFVSQIVQVIIPVGVALKSAFHIVVRKSQVVGNEMRFTREAGFKSGLLKLVTERFSGARVVVFVVQNSEV